MESVEQRLAPPPSRGPVSIVHLPHQWFIAARSADLSRDCPLACTIQGTPLVLFRADGGRPAALLDRCPHRNTPLSAGRPRDGLLECGYHGWRFDAAGVCRAVPGLCGTPDAKARHAVAYATAEHDGFVWVYSTADTAPRAGPFRFPHLDDGRYSTHRRDYVIEAPLYHALENVLDVPHTAYLHGGLFRTASTCHDIEVVVRRGADGVEAEFVGEPRPGGVIGRLLAPGGGVVTHFDRFLLPSIGQVEYRLGEHNHLLVSSVMTPVTDFTTRVWAVLSLRLRVATRLVAPLLTPVATRILAQDAAMLARQSDTIRRFGGEQLTSTEIDVLGPQMWRLLKQAERDEVPAADTAYEHRVTMRV